MGDGGVVTDTLATIAQVRENAKALRSYEYSESDTISYLIDPVLTHLGYTVRHQRREGQIRKNRPDIAIWDDPSKIPLGLPATAIIEAKQLGADLSGNGRAKQERPKEQLARYITGFERSSQNTLGVLTDGNIWHVVRSIKESRQTKLVREVRLLEGTSEEAAHALDDVERILRDTSEAPIRRPVAVAREGRAVANMIAEGTSPTGVLELFAGTSRIQTSLAGQVDLQGKAQRAESTYWESYSYATVGRIETDQADLDHESLCVAVVRMDKATSENDMTIYREDVATAAATFSRTVPVRASIVLVIQPDEFENAANARLAVHHQGHTGMTTEFDPYTPSPLVLRSLQRVYEQLRSSDPVRGSDIAEVVATKGVRQRFYEQVASGWTLRQYRKATGSLEEKRKFRQAVLRHLIRTLFVWILREEGKLPQQPFDSAFARKHVPGTFHSQLLTYMFHERLNRPTDLREAHPIAAVNEALSGIRFLNGSLFARHENDSDIDLQDVEYFGTEENSPGLFTILSEYDWTAAEHTPSHSDQAIDPEVLGNLFENLIAVTETSEVPDRMPKGTYYTPSDVAREMTKDALMLATRCRAPASWAEPDLLALFDEAEPTTPPITALERKALKLRISELTVFDPTVGSGVFLLSVITAIRTALSKLGADDETGLTRQIVSQQLFAQDLSAMAVQVARLRCFIAIIASEGNELDLPPLPNLEARLVCADTLGVVPDRQWSPVATGGLQDADVAITTALKERADIFDRWQAAHDEPSKASLRQEDEIVRGRLRKAVRAGIAGRETWAFAEHPLLEPDAPPAQTDTRLLFYKESWQGFDIVIGNPPYERLAIGQSEDDKRKTRAQLEARGYKTVKGNDTFTLVAEAGLALLNPNEGVLALVVPLSICFGRNKRQLRSLMERYSSEIRLRNHDNRPDPMMANSPVSHPENRQRTTIVLVVQSPGPGATEFRVTGTNKWKKDERHLFLRARAYSHRVASPKNLDPRLAVQWERVPTAEVADLVARLTACDMTLGSLSSLPSGSAALGIPKSAYEFITSVPTGKLRRGESTIPVGSSENLAIAMAAANSHVAYAWWKTYGDAFHVNPYEIALLGIPTSWLMDGPTRVKVLSLGRKLIRAIQPSNITKIKSGTRGSVHDSLSFHDCARTTIEEIDKLYLSGLGLSDNYVLSQLKAIRSNSTWQV